MRKRSIKAAKLEKQKSKELIVGSNGKSLVIQHIWTQAMILNWLNDTINSNYKNELENGSSKYDQNLSYALVFAPKWNTFANINDMFCL